MPILPLEFVYLAGTLLLGIPWVIIFLLRPDERNEIIVMSLGIGALSVVTAYHWWTFDWWLPATITGTRVGIEDFVMGFFSGGIISSAYELLLRKKSYRASAICPQNQMAPLLLLAFTIAYLVWFWEWSSFMASTIALLIGAIYLFWHRPDLAFSGLVAGGVMVVCAFVFFYLPIILINPQWVSATYIFDLSGLSFNSIPIEEFVFWFLAGLVFGPWYEYWKGERQRKIPV